ncbi:hypothetical protein POUND7_012500 [Theobroma cacao]
MQFAYSMRLSISNSLLVQVAAGNLKISDQYLCNLRPFQQGISVKVRIVRIWESIDPSRPDTLLSLDFLATDA